jgi:hypothetical protein
MAFDRYEEKNKIYERDFIVIPPPPPLPSNKFNKILSVVSEIKHADRGWTEATFH